MIKKISLSFVALLLVVFATSFFFYSNFQKDRLSALESDSQIANTSAGKIEYQLVGESGPVVLLLHGTPGGHDQVIPMPGLRVLAPSRPGYLRTSIEVGRTPAEQALAYAVLLDSLEIDSVIVLGISGGGPSSISFASMYPERTLALIAMEAVSQPLPAENREPIPFFLQSDFLCWATLSLVNNLMGAEGIVSSQVPDPENQQLILQNPEELENLKSMMWTLWPVSLRNAGLQNDLLHFESLDLPANKINVPTLIIHGTKDINVPFLQSEKLAEQIPGALLHVIEGGDHFMPFTHSEEVEATFAQFIESLDLD